MSPLLPRIVRASAVYDLVVTTGFALPWLAAATFGTLADGHRKLGLTGSLPDADDPFTVLFAGLMGGLVMVWSVVRVIQPSLLLGAADTVARGLFCLGMVVALTEGASTVIVGLLVPEATWGVVQGTAVLVALRRRTLTT
ncbi:MULTISPECIES: hypothetical protein [unclassified Nocardioides]|uniref:hypothetical protein n=1 Tax=unclassified Nocardioides TaxID=2615069 RepID=UPI0006F31381|nr:MULTISPECIES: hypothetical protein [unclassified Nocardioides]KRA32587.1 hypothetical protein ASD81_13690 [Nocardioides sp. Root614]KRA89240.1 hypothetical protein ASD84_13955 [Nocardioides sp. Root682]